jgi:hypothetical protein
MRHASWVWVVVSLACSDPKGAPPDASSSDDADTGDGSLDAAIDAPLDAFVIPIPPATSNGTLRLEIAESATSALVATDPNGDTLTYSIVTQPTSGTVSVDPATGAFTYTSTTLVPGSDSFTFQVNDGTADAPTPGSISITIEPALFTGQYAVTGITDNGVTCADSSVRVGHAVTQGPTAGYFDVSQHSVSSCGSTSYNYDPYRGATAGNVTASVMAFSRSESVSGCGTVTQQFRIERTLTGFTYRNVTNVPCFGVGTHTVLGTMTRTPIAYLFGEGTLTYGNRMQGSTATLPLKLRNVGRLGATAITVTGPMAPFAFTGATFPGTGGDCTDTVAGLSSCTINIDLATTMLGSFSGSWSASYNDTLASSGLSGTTSGTVIPNLTNVTAFAAGNNFTCVIENGAPICWGSSSAPTPPSLTSPTAITAGGGHACALDATGVVCWGASASGQTTVPPLTNPTLVTAGGNHTCALDATGVHCWGSNSSGQTAVPALTNPTVVSAGSSHTCALDDAGVHCWGSNSFGQSTVPMLAGATKISAGYSHSCAIASNAVTCWGSNTFGRATPPAGLINPTAIAAGGIHTCALANGFLRCWGFSLSGTPNGGGADEISAGYDHGCMRYNGGTAFRCWGTPAWP